MRRSQVVQQLLDLYEDPAYLEVGVNKGVTFRAVKAARKVAVDPVFLFDVPESNDGEAYYNVPSDDYFGNSSISEQFQLIYLDGLHTFEQTLRDFANAIERIDSNGCIVIDDIKPNSYHASLPDHHLSVRLRRALDYNLNDASWMGDTYRLTFFIESFFQQYSYATVADNHGQLVVWKSPRSAKEVPTRSVESVARTPFEAVLMEKETLNELPFTEILSLVKQSL